LPLDRGEVRFGEARIHATRVEFLSHTIERGIAERATQVLIP
jgi:hypothetical protein